MEAHTLDTQYKYRNFLLSSFNIQRTEQYTKIGTECGKGDCCPSSAAMQMSPLYIQTKVQYVLVVISFASGEKGGKHHPGGQKKEQSFALQSRSMKYFAQVMLVNLGSHRYRKKQDTIPGPCISPCCY